MSVEDSDSQDSPMAPNDDTTTSPVRFTHRPIGDVVYLDVVGELDASTGPLLITSLAEAFETGATRVVVGLRDVTFMDSSGIRNLLAAHDGATGTLDLGELSEPVRRILELAGLLDDAGQLPGAAEPS